MVPGKGRYFPGKCAWEEKFWSLDFNLKITFRILNFNSLWFLIILHITLPNLQKFLPLLIPRVLIFCKYVNFFSLFFFFLCWALDRILYWSSYIGAVGWSDPLILSLILTYFPPFSFSVLHFGIFPSNSEMFIFPPFYFSYTFLLLYCRYSIFCFYSLNFIFSNNLFSVQGWHISFFSQKMSTMYF